MPNQTTHEATTITIPYIAGDGIGAEIWQAAQPVIDAAVNKAYDNQRRIEWLEVLAGEAAFEQTGNGYRKQPSIRSRLNNTP